MTGPQKALLLEIADGANVNLISQLVRLSGDKRKERSFACAALALLKQGMLMHGDGLVISPKGRETAAKLKLKAGGK